MERDESRFDPPEDPRGSSMDGISPEDIIYDWNTVDRTGPITRDKIFILDETLRDGLQSPSVVNPNLTDKLMLIHTMDDLGIDYADVGLPGSGPKAVDDVLGICQEIVRSKLRIRPACACRTLDRDVEPIVEISQKVGIAIEVLAFIGTSPIRRFVEGWEAFRMYKLVRESIKLARRYNLPVTFVTEDTTRAKPDTLFPLYHVAVEAGASRICLSDTVAHATPDGLKNLVRFTKNVIQGMGKDIGIDWHGHNDRGLGLTNALHAVECGVTRVHGTALGIGERCGNVPIDQLMVNMKLLNVIDNDLSKMVLYCKQAALAMHWPVPKNYPVVGEDAFRTSTGVHAAAIRKAHRLGADWLADRIYSGIPASMFGLRQRVEIGQMSGESNVLFWLEQHGFPPKKSIVRRIMDIAKSSDRVLDDIELEFIARRYVDESDEDYEEQF